MHERRGLRSSIGDDNAPSSLAVKEDELPLRSASSSNFHTSSIRTHDDPNDPTNSSVKRSLSDPKTSIHPRTREKRSTKSTKSRPISMIQTSERDASWVFTEDKRNRSGSIPSDISDDSRRSSGIGDSFRSINSDGGGQVPRDGKSEVHSVQRLKKRFETGGEYHSDSSSSLASNSTHNDNNPVSRSNSNKRSNPDFTEQQHTIHEEEEHSVCNKSRTTANNFVSKLNNKDGSGGHSDSEEEEIFPSDGADTSRTLHGGDDECDGKNSRLVDHSTQTDMYDKNSVSTSDKYCSNTDLISRADAETDYEHVEWVNAGTSMRDDSTSVSVGIQCENETLIRSVSSQCGDFIHLNGVSDNNESSTDLITNKLFYTEDDSNNSTFSSKSTTPTPMMDALTSSLPERSISDMKSSENQNEKRGILKSLSDAHIPKLKENSGVSGKTVDVKVIHSRSQSDEPKRVDGNSPKHSVAEESPGMKALMALSENLEELNQQRTSSTGSKTTSKHTADGTSPGLLRKAAMINSSPQLMRRTSPNESTPKEKQVVLRSNSTNSGQVWSSSPKQITKSVSEHDMYGSKRNTWHEFDSKKLLQGMHDARFGKSERAISPVPEEGPKLERTFSKSTEQLHTPRKQKSFKKTILKKFAGADVKSVDREENVSIHTSSSDTSMDSKQVKRQMEKEKKEEKKRLKVCPHNYSLLRLRQLLAYYSFIIGYNFFSYVTNKGPTFSAKPLQNGSYETSRNGIFFSKCFDSFYPKV